MSWIFSDKTKNSNGGVKEGGTAYPGGYDYDPYHEWCQEIKEENQKRKEQTKQQLETLKNNWLKEKASLDSQPSFVEIERGIDGRFISIKGCDEVKNLLCSSIELVRITQHGVEEPRVIIDKPFPHTCGRYAKYVKDIHDWSEDHRLMPSETYFFIDDSLSEITIKLRSGDEFKHQCPEFKVQRIYNDFVNAWKFYEGD